MRNICCKIWPNIGKKFVKLFRNRQHHLFQIYQVIVYFGKTSFLHYFLPIGQGRIKVFSYVCVCVCVCVCVYVCVCVGRGVAVNKTFGHHGWPTNKNLAKTSKRRPLENGPKFGPKYKWFKIACLEFFFWNRNIILGIQLFCIRPHVPVTLPGFFLISDFLAESFKANKNYRKRSFILQCSFAQ